MEPSTPPDRPVWGPPQDPLISRTPPVDDHRAAPRRRPTAHDVRRIGGLAALASSAAIVGYMATASAAKPTSQAVIVTTATDPQPVAVPTTPVTTTPVTTTPVTTTPATTTPVTTTPVTTTPVTTPATIPTTRTRQAPPQNQPNSSSHGS